MKRLNVIKKAIEDGRDVITIWEKEDNILCVHLTHEDLLKNFSGKSELIEPYGFRNIDWCIKLSRNELEDDRKVKLLNILDDCLKYKKKLAVLIKHEITGTEKLLNLVNRYELEKFFSCDLLLYDSKLCKPNNHIVGFWQY